MQHDSNAASDRFASPVAAPGRLRLKGHPLDLPRPQPEVGGWHWAEWGCEFAGTAFQLFLGFSIVAVLETPNSPGTRAIPSAGARLGPDRRGVRLARRDRGGPRASRQSS